MKYQIVGTDEDDTEIIIYSLDNLKIATSKFELVVILAKEPNYMPFELPPWKSIELQQVESISSSRIDLWTLWSQHHQFSTRFTEDSILRHCLTSRWWGLILISGMRFRRSHPLTDAAAGVILSSPAPTDRNIGCIPLGTVTKKATRNRRLF